MNDIHEAIKPVYIFSNILLMKNYTTKLENGQRKYFNENNFFLKYFGITIWFIFSLKLISNTINGFLYNFIIVDKIVAIVFILQFCVLFIFINIVIISYIFTNHKYANIFNKLQKIDDKMKLLTIFIDNKFIKRKIIKIYVIKTIFLIIFTIINVYFCAVHPSKIYVYIESFFLNIILLCFLLCFSLNFIVLVMVISARFKALNENLKDIIRCTSSASRNKNKIIIRVLLKSSYLYKKLYEILIDISSIFSFQLLAYLGLVFIIILTYIYFIFTEIFINGQISNRILAIRSLFFYTYYSLDLFALIYVCAKVKYNVSYEF